MLNIETCIIFFLNFFYLTLQFQIKPLFEQKQQQQQQQHQQQHQQQQEQHKAFYYQPSEVVNNYPFYVPPLQTYNICPELFYFFDYEPFIKGDELKTPVSFKQTIPFQPNIFNEMNTEQITRLRNETDYFFNMFNKRRNSSQFLPQIQLNPNRPWINTPDQVQSQPKQFYEADGPFYKIISQVYDKCCPLNRNRLSPVKVKDDSSLYEYLFESFSNQTHILHYQSQGMFSIMEFFNHQTENILNPYYVQIMNSQAFYLISKRERNGSPTITPIALTILLNAWPLLVFILLANIYSGIFIWFLDRTLKRYQLPKQFVKGTGKGIWWSFFLFTATSLAPRIDFRGWIIRIFTVIWMMVSLVMIVIFISMFTTQLTMYALNGQSLNEKTIGINKYSTDRIWLEHENSIPVEYDSIMDMLRDLEDQKIEYILLDQLFANFYSRIIAEKFYIMRQVNRKKSFNILLRGFNSEQLTCFQTTSSIFFQQWLKQNLTSNSAKIKDTSEYFSITDELLYPQRNAILFLAIGFLVMIFIIGISWEITCMRQPGLSALGGGGRGGGGAGGMFNRMINEGGRRVRRSDNDIPSLNGVNSLIGDGIEAASRLNGPGATAGGAVARSGENAAGGGSGGGALSSLGRSLFNQNPISGLVDNISNVRSFIPSFLSPNTFNFNHDSEYLDRSVKFNPLVHNFYYNNNNNKNNRLNSSTEMYDKALINARDQALTNQSYRSDSDSDNFISGSKNWNYLRMNEKPVFDDFVKENKKSKNEYQLEGQAYAKAPCKYNYTSTPSSTSFGNMSNESNTKTNITRVDLPGSFSSQDQYTLKKHINYRASSLSNRSKDGIILNQPLSNLCNQESNTDENLDSNIQNFASISHPGLPAGLKNEIEKKSLNTNPNNSISISNSSDRATVGSIYSNPLPNHHKELARNESFYLTEYSSVKL